MNRTWFKVTLSAAVIASTGIAMWEIIDRLDDKTFSVLLGMVIVLVIVIVVGLLFLGYGLSQAYVSRRLLQQDDLNDMRQMAMLGTLLRGGQQPSVRVNNSPTTGPANADPWATWAQPMLPPRIQDTTGTDAGTIEIE